MAFYPSESKVLSDPTVFSEEYLSQKFEVRDSERSWLTRQFEPAAQGLKPTHVWVHGLSGSGKTSLVEWTLSSLKKTKGLQWMRLNCWVDPTYYLALDRLCRELRILRAEQQSASLKLHRLRQHWAGTPFFLVLDEIDMMAPKERATLLYNLSNVDKVGLVAIAYNQRSLASLDARVRSRLNPNMLQFKAYSPKQLEEILAARAEEGLHPGTWEADILQRIARLSGHDSRLAIQTLGRAARHAERTGASRLSEEHVKEAWTGLTELKTIRKLEGLTQHHRILHFLVNQAQEITSQDLWRSYAKTCKSRKLKSIAPRTFLVYLNRLVRLRLIDEDYVIDRGRVRVLRAPDHPSED